MRRLLLTLVAGSVCLLAAAPHPEPGPAIKSGYFQTSDNVRLHYLEYIRKVIDSSLMTPTNTALALMVTGLGRDFRPMLGKIDRPLLYAITPQLAEDAELLKARVPAARVVVFQNSGHVLYKDEAERFNALLEEFVRAASTWTEGQLGLGRKSPSPDNSRTRAPEARQLNSPARKRGVGWVCNQAPAGRHSVVPPLKGLDRLSA